MTLRAIVRRSADIPGREIGADDGVRLAVLGGPSDFGFGATVALEEWQPNGAQPWNRHPESSELFLILTGEGVVWCDDERIPVGAGDVVILPPGSRHRIINTGDGALRSVTVMAPDHGFAGLIEAGRPTAPIRPTQSHNERHSQ